MSAVAAKLIEECKSLGISLRPGEGGRLKVSPPPERLPAELRENLKQYKTAVLALLVPSRPYLTEHGELFIPSNCDPRYHYWKPGGQNLAQTLAELDAPPEVWRRYVMGYTETRQ